MDLNEFVTYVLIGILYVVTGVMVGFVLIVTTLFLLS